MPSTSSRSPWLDMIKGLACVAIVWHHLAFYGPMSHSAAPLLPDVMAWLSDSARMAVQVFLVVGGYLSAASLAPRGVARFEQLAPVVLRRLVRLVVPYAVALLGAVLAASLVRPWMAHDSVPGAPDVAQLLANGLLLQDILDEDALSAGAWYVAIDFQLFTCAAALAAGARWLTRRRWPQATQLLTQAAVVALTVASLWVFNRDADLDMWAIYFFGAYGMGMLAFWSVHAAGNACATRWALVIAVVGVVALALDFRGRIVVAVVTALALVLLLRSPHCASVRGWRPLVSLGRMSYSVFLTHFAVCLLVNAAVSTLWPSAPWINLAGMVLAFVLSLLAGRLLYLRVERHVPTVTTALRWQVGLLATGWLVSLSGY